MAHVWGIALRLQIGQSSGAGSDGDLYLGFAGREFFVDSDANDFGRSSVRNYAFGGFDSNSFHPAYPLTPVRLGEFNDPRIPVIDTSAIDEHPVYLRFKGVTPDDNIQLAGAWLYMQFDTGWGDRGFMLPLPNLWLGTRRGEMVYLKRTS
jgi:hypothetical protein